ncbi:MAG TPA: hypothetical protein PKA88_18365, partial [Polyangiaceae bacterium]|nr:hypothetical protein [Polyangiaceae bacterium]
MRTLAIATTLFAIALPYTAPGPRLASDDTMARVHDRQGMAFFRPLASERWTPVDRRTRLRVGDSLRTSARGANAVEVGLRGGEKLVAGPGTLLRLVDETTIEVVSGDLEVSPAEAGPGAANPGKKKSELTLRGI